MTGRAQRPGAPGARPITLGGGAGSLRMPRAARLLLAGTALRIVLAPVVMALVLTGGATARAVAAAIFAFAAATDLLDGYLARRWGVTTTLGSFLDTTADKLLVAAVLVALVAAGRASPWLAALIVGREMAVLGLRGTAAAAGTVFPPSPGGRLKAVVQFVALFLAILRPGDPIGFAYADEWAMLAAAAITTVTGIDYFVRFSSALRRSE
jgi:CDP-diacylglycerol--glycerol-3-phosphate 3-phosphatidyltransferase